MKKLKILLIILLTIFFVSISQVNATELSSFDSILKNENLYTKLNNIIITSMDNYNEGKISEEEYLRIMEEVNTFLSNKSNYLKLKEDEAKWYTSKATIRSSTCTTGGGDQEAYLYFNTLTGEEIALFAQHPINSIKAKNLATQASEKTNDWYDSYVLWQGNGDAFRHAYWSALMTKHISRDFAYDVGLAHEGLSRNYNFDSQGADTKMDISNNYSGRILGDNNKNKSDSQIATIIKNSVSNGNLKRIRTYTSVPSYIDCYISGVPTKYVGYYVQTSDGGLK